MTTLLEIVKTSEAYRDLETPVILAGGALGIYFVNGEKVSGIQPDTLKALGDNATELIQHANGLAQENADYQQVLAAMEARMGPILGGRTESIAISGGQTRDWIFSGPVATRLHLPHIAIYKDGRVELTMPDGEIHRDPDLTGYFVVHAVDMLTAGSSCYDPKNNPPTGWIPLLRGRNATADHVVAFLDRKQKGTENLAQASPPIHVHSLVSIDDTTLPELSSNPEQAIAYFKNPEQWTRDYLADGDLSVLVKFFDPASGKLKHAVNFNRDFGIFLRTTNKHGSEYGSRYAELNALVQDSYGKGIDEILEGAK